MKKFNLLFALVLLSCNWSFAQQAKYVFYFIGDGMGVNQVQGTELFQGELKGEIGISPLCFTQFPVSTVATTFSAIQRCDGLGSCRNCLGYRKQNQERCHRSIERLGNTGKQCCRMGKKQWQKSRYRNKRQCRPCHSLLLSMLTKPDEAAIII